MNNSSTNIKKILSPEAIGLKTEVCCETQFWNSDCIPDFKTFSSEWCTLGS